MPDNDLTASDTSDAATGTDRYSEEEARYVPVVEMLLDRTTPLDLPSIDIGWLAQLDRKRKRRRTAAASVATVAAVVGLTAGTVALTSGANRPPDVGIAPAGPDGQPLTEPVGAWRQAAAPPYAPRSNAVGAALSDGRMIIWGGRNEQGDQTAEALTESTDGGIYDPETDSWEEIPKAPVPPPTGGGTGTTTHLVDDRLAIITGGTDGSVNVAVYDVAEGSWVKAPAQDSITGVYDASAWDGETLVIVRTREGGTIDEPITLRWQLGDDAWTSGAPFPHGVRNMVGAAADGSKLALWGGTPEQSLGVMEESWDVYGDGAIYNIAEDTWQPIPEGPLTGGANVDMTWWNGSVLVGSRQGEEAGYEFPADLAAYDPVSETWETLPPSPKGGAGVAGKDRGPGAFFDGQEPIVAAVVNESAVGNAGDEIKPRWFLTGGAWEPAPLPGLRRIGDLIVADTDDAIRAGGMSPILDYELQIRVGPNEWFDAAEAPFEKHWTMAKATNDEQMLMIVGDTTAGNPRAEHAVWIFDLTG